MKNPTKYEYLPILQDDGVELRNIVVEADSAYTQPHADAKRIHAGLLELYNLLIEKRPTWDFVATTTHDAKNPTRSQNRMRVYANGECLGTIDRRWDHYTIKNFRMENRLGRQPKGYSIPAMSKRIIKDFRQRNNEEQYRAARMDTALAYQHEVDDLRHPWTWVKDRFQAVVMRKACEQWDKYEDLLKEAALPEDAREKFETWRWTEDNFERLSPAKVQVVVAREDGVYLFKDDDGNLVATEQLIGWRQTNVALLKVAPDKTFLRDVGMKDGNVFRIMKYESTEVETVDG